MCSYERNALTAVTAVTDWSSRRICALGLVGDSGTVVPGTVVPERKKDDSLTVYMVAEEEIVRIRVDIRSIPLARFTFVT